MFNITRDDHFRIDTVLPAIQTAAVYGTMEGLGRLGQYRVATQTAVLVAAVASLISALTSSIFKDLQSRMVDYGSILLGIAAGIAAHRFFYPAIPTQAILDTRGIATITAVLAAVKLTAYAIQCYQVKEKVKEVAQEVKQEVKDAGQAAKQSAAALVEQAAIEVEKGAAKVEDAAAAAAATPAKVQ